MPAPLRDRRRRPLRDLRISVTDRCNLRCTYCMPAELFDGHAFLPRREILSFEEIERLARRFVALGVTKLRITGGEPLLRRDLPHLVARLAAIPGVEDLALTTNGLLLPRLATALREAGLARLTISLDTLDPTVFARLSGRELTPEQVLAGLAAAEAAGFAQVKINAVVQRGVNDAEIVRLAERFRGTGHVLRFIEYMDVGSTNGWRSEQVVPAAEIVARIGERFPLVELPRRHENETALRFRYRDGAGEVGVIASVTRPFCGACSRARLSAKGELFTCLFATHGLDLRALLRGGASDAELEARLRTLWGEREDRYSEERAAGATPPDSKVEMSYIGG